MPGISPPYKLSGYTVIVTRPAEQAEKLCEMIESAGGQTLRFPLIRIAEPADVAASRQRLAMLSSYDLVIFVSANAAAQTLRLLAPQRIESPIKIAAIGPSTATVLKKHDYDVWTPPSRSTDSESLLKDALFTHVNHQRIAIIRGDGGRDLIAKTLKKRGAKVDYIEVYRRLKPSVEPGLLFKALADPGLLLLSITSNQGLHNLMELVDKELKPSLLKIPLIVLSKRTQALAATLGFKNILVVRQISDHGIMEALQRFIHR